MTIRRQATREGKVWRCTPRGNVSNLGYGSFTYVVLCSDDRDGTSQNGTQHRRLVLQDSTAHSGTCPYVTHVREYASWNNMDTMYQRIA